MIFEINENIPISVILLKNNATPDTGQLPTIYIYNDTTSTLIVSGGSLTESLVGYYTYNFIHGQTINTTFTYYVINSNTVIASGKFRVITTKKDLTDTIDFADGKAI